MASSESGGSGSDLDAPPTIPTLLRRARKLREDEMLGDDALPPSFRLDSSRLRYPSSVYNMETDSSNRSGKTAVQRGFCNWLVPGRVMLGQYPGTTPERNGPSSEESRLHLQNMVRDA